jgi:hypothetical protein
VADGSSVLQQRLDAGCDTDCQFIELTFLQVKSREREPFECQTVELAFQQ